jgi:hypothetical protein
MDFTLNNGLSMVGGDDFTTINNEIATLNDTVVFKAGAQTITGDKSFSGVLQVDNSATTIVGTTVEISSDALELKSANGDAKYSHNATQSSIQNNNVFIADATGTSGIIVSSVGVALEAPTAGSITQDIGVNTKSTINSTDTTLTNGEIDLTATTGLISITAADAVLLDGASAGILLRTNTLTKANITMTDTTLTNDTVNIVSGTNKVAISGTATTLDNTTTNIRSGGTNKITTNATTTTLNNTGGTTLQIASDPKISLLSASTTLNNTATFINTGGALRYSNNATDTIIRNSLLQLQAAALDVKYNQTATQTDITNTTVNIGGTTGGVDITATTGGISLITTGVADIVVNASGAGGFLTMSSANTTLNDNTGANKFIQDSSTTKLYNAGITLATAFPATSANTKYIHSTTATTITNTTINLQDATPTTRFTQTNGTTTITNTNINATGLFFTNRYYLGSSGGSSRQLASMNIPLGSCLIPTATGLGTTTTTGNWSFSGTSSQIRTPSWGTFYPLYVMVGFDNGSITGGGIMTFAVQLREETNNYTMATTAQTLTSGTNNASTGGSQDIDVFSSANKGIGSGVLIRFQIVIARTASITASTKTCYATFYGYQTD